MLYDLFICHSSEDKDAFVRPLAEALRKEHIEVWYDEFSLKLGDSIRRSIDKGLSQSRFGVVVISKSFLKKEWPQYELDGLLEKEINGKEIVMLPIWHKITHQEIFKYSPSLAGKKASNSKNGLDIIVKEIISVIHPQSSPLIIARDTLIEWGITPPVITDEYWLDVVEASNRSNSFGAAIAPEAIWGRWCFPLPERTRDPKHWGERLAWTAMQMRWIQKAVEVPISPLSKPEVVLDFINTMPGLFETCEMIPELTAEYAPQLTIRTFGGDLEQIFEAEYLKSFNKRKKEKQNGSRNGSALTVDGQSPECDEEWALRHENLGFYEPRQISYSYFHGGMFGPHVSPFEEAEHLFWLLSAQSNWLPNNIHSYLLSGLLSANNWTWSGFGSDKGGLWKSNGSFESDLHTCIDKKRQFQWKKSTTDDCMHRIKAAIDILKLPETVQEIFDKVVELDLPNIWIKSRIELDKKRKRKG